MQASLQPKLVQTKSLPGRVRNFRTDVKGSQTIQVDWDEPVKNSPNQDESSIRYRLFYVKSNASMEDEEETQLLVSTHIRTPQ